MIELKHISVIFNQNTALEATALLDLNLKIAPGDFITLVGGNGAGKSTLLNLLSGEFKPTRGKLFLDGKDISQQSMEERSVHFSHVYQDPRIGTCEAFTLEENLAFANKRGQSRGLKPALTASQRELFKERLASLGLGLEKRLQDKLALFSGGQRQVISLVMASLQPSKILLLDEHTAALDPKASKIVLDLSERLVREHQLTTIMITHHLADALGLGNRTLLMRQGRLIRDITNKERQNLSPETLLEYF